MDLLDRILWDLKRRNLVADTQTLLDVERSWRDQWGGNRHFIGYRPGDVSRRGAAQCRAAGMVASDAASTIGLERTYCLRLLRG